MDLRSGKISNMREDEDNGEERQENRTESEASQSEPQSGLADLLKMLQNMERDRKEQDRKQEEGRKLENEELKQIITENFENMKTTMDKKFEEIKKEVRKEQLEFEEKVEKKINTIEQKTVEFEIRQKTKESQCKNRMVQVWENFDKMEKTIQEKNEETDHELHRLEKKIEENKEKLEDMDRQVRRRENVQGHNGITENEEIKKMREELQEEIKKLQEKQTHLTQTRIYTCTNNNNTIKYDGHYKNIHPVLFIRTLKHKIRHVHDIEDIKELIRDNLTRDSLIWFAGKEHDIDTFQKFETLFLSYFWGEDTQNKVRENLYFGKYRTDKGTSMSKYALQLYAISQYLTPYMPENEVVIYISRHFKPEIAESLAIHNISTMDKLCTYLNRIERNNIRSNIHSNYNNGPNNRNNNFRGTQINDNNNLQNYSNNSQPQYNRQYNNHQRYNNNNYNNFNRGNRNYQNRNEAPYQNNNNNNVHNRNYNGGNYNNNFNRNYGRYNSNYNNNNFNGNRTSNNISNNNNNDEHQNFRNNSAPQRQVHFQRCSRSADRSDGDDRQNYNRAQTRSLDGEVERQVTPSTSYEVDTSQNF